MYAPYVKLIPLSHQRIVQQMPVNLRLDQDQIDEYDHEVMLDIFIAEMPTILAYRQSHALAAGRFICALVFGVKSLDGKATFYTNRHLMYTPEKLDTVVMRA